MEGAGLENSRKQISQSCSSSRTAKKIGVVWEDDETSLLLEIWASEEIQRSFSKAKRHNLVYEKIMKIHNETGNYTRNMSEVK